MKLFEKKEKNPGETNPKISLDGVNPTAISKTLNQLFKTVFPISLPGGLSVSDSGFYYSLFDENGKLVRGIALKTPTGAVEKGRIKNNQAVVSVLKELGRMAGIEFGKTSVILSIPDNLVYSQVMTIPETAEADLKETIELNIKTISPMDLTKAYYDYEIIGQADTGFGKDILVSFIQSEMSDEWSHALKEAGFVPVAVEFSSFSLARMAEGIVKPDELAMVIDISVGGISQIVLKNRKMAFDYLVPWTTIQGAEERISFDRMKEALFSEINKVINFSIGKFGGEIKTLILNSAGMVDELLAALSSAFPKLKIIRLDLPGGKTADFAVSIGAAKRGVIPRSKDEMIALNSVVVIKEFEEIRMLLAMQYWRRFALAMMSFILLTISAGDLLVNKFLYIPEPPVDVSQTETVEYNRLKAKAAEFNSLVSSIYSIRSEENKITDFINMLNATSGSDIRLTKIAYQGPTQPVVINGVAPSTSVVSNFQTQLSKVSGISNIDFPLASVQVLPSGETSFIMSFSAVLETFNAK